MKKLIGVKDLSSYLGVSVRTVYQWTHMKVVPHYKVGAGVRFDEADIEKWLERRKQPVSKFAGLYFESMQ